MNTYEQVLHRTSILVLVGCLLSGCVGVGVQNVLPDRITDSFDRVEEGETIALKFTPIPEGEELKIGVGPMQYSLNSVFLGMVEEMLTSKFGELTKDAESRLTVRVAYLNPQYETYGGTMSRLDMAVYVSVHDGVRTVERELSFSQISEYDGYALRSDEIQWLLARFTVAIDEMIDKQFVTEPNLPSRRAATDSLEQE